jgi:hypothetical protein
MKIRQTIEQLFCLHKEKDINYYQANYWGKDGFSQVLGGNAIRIEKCMKCGRVKESDGWYLPPLLSKNLKPKPNMEN